MNRHKLVNWIVYVLIAVGALALIVLLAGDYRQEQAALAKARELDAARQPLLQRRSIINDELAGMTREEARILHTASVQILFAEPDRRILTEAAPLMAGYGFPGMIAVSADMFPGDAGCLSVQETLQLTTQGWGISLSASQGTDLAALTGRLQAAGLPAAQAVYFPAGDCTSEMAAQAAGLGVHVVILYGAQPPEGAPEEIWFLQARGAMDDGLGSLYEWALANHGGFVMTEGWNEPRELFSVDDLRISLTTMEASSTVGDLHICTASAAWEEYAAIEAQRAEVQRLNASRRAELESELARIDEELAEINARYR